MAATNDDAIKIAAQSLGLRPDQVEQAVTRYREAVSEIESEPEWHALMHGSGRGFNTHQYIAEGTAIVLQIDSWKERGEWRQEKHYVFKGKPYEHFAEARGAEMKTEAKPLPYSLPRPKATA